MDEIARRWQEGRGRLLEATDARLRKREDGVKQARRATEIEIEGSSTLETPRSADEVIGPERLPQGGRAMSGGWRFTRRPEGSRSAKVKIVAVDALPAELAYVDKGLAPVLLAQPTYMWGYVGVQRIFDKVQLKQDVPQIIPMELVRVTKDNLGTWARQLKDWGFTDVAEEYLKCVSDQPGGSLRAPERRPTAERRTMPLHPASAVAHRQRFRGWSLDEVAWRSEGAAMTLCGENGAARARRKIVAGATPGWRAGWKSSGARCDSIRGRALAAGIGR